MNNTSIYIHARTHARMHAKRKKYIFLTLTLEKLVTVCTMYTCLTSIWLYGASTITTIVVVVVVVGRCKHCCSYSTHFLLPFSSSTSFSSSSSHCHSIQHSTSIVDDFCCCYYTSSGSYRYCWLYKYFCIKVQLLLYCICFIPFLVCCVFFFSSYGRVRCYEQCYCHRCCFYAHFEVFLFVSYSIAIK